ncbi:2-dehydropantoate 2-reductase [Niallia sp. XMNu-256]|uniref:2-dehydropantoate 2-reductase n=1 Tax=Niallia sp. XMNu-256 TaxID=3082444 RepID=UPI0030D16746
MKIGIIGGGAIGLLFSYYLSRRHSVCLYVHSSEQRNLIQEEGFLFEKNGHRAREFVQVKLSTQWRGEEEVTFIALKQYHLPHIIDMLSTYSTNGHALCFLQNGMGHLKWFDGLNGDIYVGSVEHGAMKVGHNHVIHTGVGTTKTALFRGDSPNFMDFVQSIEDDFFSFVVEEQYEKMLIKKLVANAVINPLTSILQIKNGELINNPYYFRLVKSMFAEIIESLQLKESEEYFLNVIEVCKLTAHNDSSMLRDLKEKRLTEVDAILGYILEKAAENEIHTPIIDLFYQAVKGKECRVED